MSLSYEQLAQTIQKSYENSAALVINTLDLQNINAQLYFDEQFSQDNQYRQKQPFDPILPPSKPLLIIQDFSVKISQIEQLDLTISNQQFRINLSRFKMLKRLSINGEIAPEVYFGDSKMTLKQLVLHCPLETASSVLLSGILPEDQQKILNIRDLSSFSVDSAKSKEQLELIDKYYWLLESISFEGCSVYVMDASLLLLKYVKSINLANNQICRVQYLWNSYSLDTLDLSFNQITDLINLHKSLGQVRKCYFRGNYLEKIDELALLKGIQELDLSENLISDENQIALLAKLPFLQILFINGNPVFQSRKQIIGILQKQMVLNGLMVDQDEIIIDRTKDKIIPLSYQRSLMLKRMFNNSVNKNNQNYGTLLLKETKDIVSDLGIDYFGASSVNVQAVQKMSDMEKTILKYNVDGLYDLQQQLKRNVADSNVTSFELAQRANQAMLTSCIQLESGKYSMRPSGLYPFGVSVKHPNVFKAKPISIDKYWQEQKLSEGVKYRTNYHQFEGLIEKQINQQQNQVFERKHLVIPCQKIQQVDFTLQTQLMQHEDDISLIQYQILCLERNYYQLLKDEVFDWITTYQPDFIQQFLVKYNQKDLRQMLEVIGIHRVISIATLTKLSEFYLSAAVNAVARLLTNFAIDLALLLLYDFFKKILQYLKIQNSEERAEESLKRLNLKYQELKTEAENVQLELKAKQDGLKTPEDTPIACLIQYMFENKLFERRIVGASIEPTEQKADEEQQFINVKVIDGYKVYKFYDQRKGKIVKVRRQQLENGDEGSDEPIEEADDGADDEDIEFQRKQVTREELDRKLEMEMYKPDAEQFVKKLSVCVPFGDDQVYVDMRELQINLETGELIESQNGVTRKTENLANLVTYIIPKTNIIEPIYKCVILLFAEKEAQGEAQDEAAEVEAKSKEEEEGAIENSPKSESESEFDPLNFNIEDNDDDDGDGREIPYSKCIDALPILNKDQIVRPELQIALPGVSEEQVSAMIEHTLNLQTENSYDPLRTAYSFKEKPKKAFHSTLIYFLSSEPVQSKNMSQLSSFTELLELITLPLLKAYKPTAQQTFWGYCLRCSTTFRAVVSEAQELQQEDVSKSNCYTTIQDYKLQNQKETGDESQSAIYRKISIFNAQQKQIPALINGYEENDYYQQNYAFVRYDEAQSTVQQEQVPLIACPHCQASANYQPNQLNMDIRRRIRAIEELQTGKELHLPGVDTDQRKVNVESNDVLWETIKYKQFSVQAEKIREVESLQGNPQIVTQQIPDDIYYWVIQRPSQLPSESLYDTYSCLLDDFIQRKILVDAFKTVAMPQPAKRYLKLLGEDEEPIENIAQELPRQEEVDVQQLETDSETANSNENSQATEEFEQDDKLEEVIQEKHSLETIQVYLKQQQFSYTSLKLPRQLFPFNIDEYQPNNAIYYTQFYEHNPSEVVFRGYLEYSTDEFQCKNSDCQKKMVMALLNVSDLDMNNYIGAWFVYHIKAKGVQKVCILVLLKDSISFVYLKPQSSVTHSKFLRSYAEQFCRVTKPIFCLETATFCSSLELKFTKLVTNYQIKSAVLSPLQQSPNSIIPDTDEVDYILSDQFAMIEIIQALSHLIEIQNIQFQMLKSLQLVQDIKNQQNKILQFIPISFNRALVIDEKLFYIAKIQPGNPKGDIEYKTQREINDIKQIKVARIAESRLLLVFGKQKELEIDCIEWRKRAVICQQIQRSLEEQDIEVEICWE